MRKDQNDKCKFLSKFDKEDVGKKGNLVFVKLPSQKCKTFYGQKSSGLIYLISREEKQQFKCILQKDCKCFSLSKKENTYICLFKT